MKALVVLSGGMDSTVALYHTLKSSGVTSVEAISFNYGSKHNDAEFECAKQTTEKLGIPHKRVDLPFINDLFKSDLLKSGGEIPEGHYADSNMKRTVVPFRNGIMLAIAAGYAESVGAEVLVLGNHFGDHAVYPDCRADFINPMSEAIKNGTYTKVEICSPFVDKTKTDIAKLGQELGVDFAKTYSCYKGGPVQCGLCSTCFERREAFVDAGVVDPTEYSDNTPFEELRQRYTKN